MKINESQPVQRVNPYQKHSYSGRDSNQIKSERKTDQVSISEEAIHLAQTPDAEESAVQQAERANRENRIHDLKSSIQDGTYAVDAREVARKVYDAFSQSQS
ncbi:flagellar biosynthesis anti-sigma factor FlgM [Fodinisporobacter ferrooxydans]|uniref:Flagellar biosynthesis anti-sigma factor FlgM n=1 Tax=Fodinisporobacter ferrooxydans TaxID=2901836 RepID=A0ABY4CLX4_9BACL|nr:flagellar biosynthesis anti-sigma factor FlgM [Alicyclobacillaceae bacterium MYW30-H2]